MNGHPGAMNYSYSPLLRNFTKATNICLRFLRTNNTLLGHLMGKALRAPTVMHQILAPKTLNSDFNWLSSKARRECSPPCPPHEHRGLQGLCGLAGGGAPVMPRGFACGVAGGMRGRSAAMLAFPVRAICRLLARPQTRSECDLLVLTQT
ncbi:uncharacterized protein LOC123626387 isoform X1 [Lemur catta]|uniref:uncharacterized protein LOC123626387 isoform X1 n=1 Tax=Lemur catta TaxID=9447 RepID=UPI001E26B2D0|nr:uncharacterized protein LOC123626387 isoform X1 [Lemur catta]